MFNERKREYSVQQEVAATVYAVAAAILPLVHSCLMPHCFCPTAQRLQLQSTDTSTTNA